MSWDTVSKIINLIACGLYVEIEFAKWVMFGANMTAQCHRYSTKYVDFI